MSPRLGALVRTVLLIGLFVLSAAYDPLPAWWFFALAVILVWTLADFLRWTEEGAERTDDDD